MPTAPRQKAVLAAGSHVSYEGAREFLRRCRRRPERMRAMCSTKAFRPGGDKLAVTVQVTPCGPTVTVREVSMAEGWTGHRFSPCALWLALELARQSPEPVAEGDVAALGAPRALELGCGVALAGLTAHALGYEATLTDCLPGHLQSLSQHVQDHLASEASGCPSPPRVRCLDWLEFATSAKAPVGAVDRGSPENQGGVVPSAWERLSSEEAQSFDVVLASDILYEEHHATLLPLVVERWLKPGGMWRFALAIRDAGMMQRFLRSMLASHLLEHIKDGEATWICGFTWETACEPKQCPFCAQLVPKCCSSDAATRDAGGGGLPGKMMAADTSSSLIPLQFLEELIEGHEGGAVLLQGQRPPRARGASESDSVCSSL